MFGLIMGYNDVLFLEFDEYMYMFIFRIGMCEVYLFWCCNV